MREIFIFSLFLIIANAQDGVYYFSSSSLDVSVSPANQSITVLPTSNVSSVLITLRPPQGIPQQPFVNIPLTNSGSQFETVLFIPKYSTSGFWYVDSIATVDFNGTLAVYTSANLSLWTRPDPNGFFVDTGVPDISPPKLLGLSIDPIFNMSLATTATNFYFNITCSDATGVRNAYMDMDISWGSDQTIIEGDIYNGVFQSQITLPTSVGIVEQNKTFSIILTDFSGNSRLFSWEYLKEHGFPYYIHFVPVPYPSPINISISETSMNVTDAITQLVISVTLDSPATAMTMNLESNDTERYLSSENYYFNSDNTVGTFTFNIYPWNYGGTYHIAFIQASTYYNFLGLYQPDISKIPGNAIISIVTGEDSAPPTANLNSQNLTIVPSVFQYDYGSYENVTFTVHLLDNVSGVSSAQVGLRSDTSTCQTLYFTLINGTTNDGFWEAWVVFEDTYCYTSVIYSDFAIQDVVGNLRYIQVPGTIVFTSGGGCEADIFDGNSQDAPAVLPYPGIWTGLNYCKRDFYTFNVAQSMTINLTIFDFGILFPQISFDDGNSDNNVADFCDSFSSAEIAVYICNLYPSDYYLTMGSESNIGNYSLAVTCIGNCTSSCPNLQCNGRGSPNYVTCKCTCQMGFGGYYCQRLAVCDTLNYCNGRGSCIGDGVCSCDDRFNGTDCSSCSKSYYGYNCVKSCGLCNHGHCGPDGTCICDDRWTGPTCSSCAPGYFGSDCTAGPYIDHIEPSYGYESTVVYLYGYNLYNSSSWTVEFNYVSVPATFINSTVLSCVAPPFVSTTISISVYNDSSYTQSNTLVYYYLGYCNSNTFCNGVGYCQFAYCQCDYGHVGLTCTGTTYAPYIIANDGYAQEHYTSTYQIYVSGADPITLELVTYPQEYAANITFDQQKGIVTWFNPVARFQPYAFAVKATNYLGEFVAPFNIYVVPAYDVIFTGNVSAIVDYQSPIQITGYIESDPTFPVLNQPVNIYVTTNTVSVAKTTYTDQSGNFTYLYIPSPNEIGQAELVVKHPVSTNKESSAFTWTFFEFIGLSTSPENSALPVYSYIGTSTLSYNSLINLSERNISGITGYASFHGNMTVNIGVKSSLAPGESAPIYVTVMSGSVVNLTLVDITFTSNEGATTKMSIYVTVPKLSPKLVSKTKFQGNFLTGEQHIFEYIISNEGAGETGILSVTFPALLNIILLTPNVIPSLQPGETYSIFFLISLDSSKRDIGDTVVSNVIVSSETALLSDTVTVTPTTNTTASLSVHIMDDSNMSIVGAQVEITGLSGSYTGISGSTGDIQFALDIGTYQVLATSPAHYKYQNTLSITSLQPISLDIVLPIINTQVTYTGQVDVTGRQLTVKTSTSTTSNSTLPYVTVEPSIISLDGLMGDYIPQILFTITNKGPGVASGVTLELPQDPSVSFQILIDTIGDLAENISVAIPVFVTTYSTPIASDCLVGGVTWNSALSTPISFSQNSLPCPDSNSGLQSRVSSPIVQKAVSCDVLACQRTVYNSLLEFTTFGYFTDTSLTSGKIPITMVTCAAQCNYPVTGNLTQILNLIDTAYNLGITSACTSGTTYYVTIVTALATNNNRDIAFANIVQYLGRIKSWISFVQFIFNDNVWLQLLNDPDWSFAFLSVAAEDSDSSFQISPTEFLNLRAPYSYGSIVNISHVETFVQRWNDTFGNWNGNNLFSSDNSFIDYNKMLSLYNKLSNDHGIAQNQGYRNIFQGFNGALQDFATATSPENSESCFLFKLSANNRAIVAGDSFVVELLLVNPSNVTINNVNISLLINDKTTQLPAGQYFNVSVPTISGVAGGIGGVGTIQGSSQAKVTWTITSFNTTASGPTAKSYSIGGSVGYVQGLTILTVPFFEDVVINYPPPVLQVHYFLPKVFVGDNPSTSTVEPSLPTPMGMFVQNSGYGNAFEMAVDSIKATMIDSLYGLKTKYQLLDTKIVTTNETVDSSPVFNAQIGDVTKIQSAGVLWTLSAQTASKFKTFATSEKHVDDVGNTRPSAIFSQVSHNLVFAAQIESAESATFAFICDDITDPLSVPDTLYYISNTLVSSPLQSLNISDVTITPIDGSTFDISFAKTGVVLLTISNPSLNSSNALTKVLKDSVPLPSKSFWQSSDNNLHILDIHSTGQYRLVFNALAFVTNFSVIVNGTNRIGFSWNPVPGAEFYKVQYKISTASTFLTLSNTVISSYFVANDLTASTTYIFKVYAGNQFQYETVGSTFTAATLDIPVTCPSCGPNGTVSYAGSACYCSCHVDCGSMYLDTSDCTCNPCKSNVGTLLDGASCDDGDNCTESDVCSNGFCTSGNFICGDLCAGIECLPSECNNASCIVIGNSPVCKSTPIEDGSGCSTGVCKLGQCESNSVAQSKSKASSHVGLIVGVVIAGVVVIALAVAAFVFMKKRKSMKGGDSIEMHSK